jgi:hypothetical protein
MFMANRQEVLEFLYERGREACCYSVDNWSPFCDCKYGGPRKDKPMSEQTGCPELRTIYSIINAMSDSNWSAFAQVAGGIVHGERGQRQDSVTDQMKDLMKLAAERGMYDAHEWLRVNFNTRTDEEHTPTTRWPMSSQWAWDECEVCGESWPCSYIRRLTGGT